MLLRLSAFSLRRLGIVLFRPPNPFENVSNGIHRVLTYLEEALMRISRVVCNEHIVAVNQRMHATYRKVAGNDSALSAVRCELDLGMRDEKALCELGGNSFGPVFSGFRSSVFEKPLRPAP